GSDFLSLYLTSVESLIYTHTITHAPIHTRRHTSTQTEGSTVWSALSSALQGCTGSVCVFEQVNICGTAGVFGEGAQRGRHRQVDVTTCAAKLLSAGYW
uniref:Uncharacterized protein n=1 Tax=Oncorhynchus kisutch TaxID=8019 RepID=A0A8C7D3V4_ONCKI